jgi:dihydropyrimidine dehydrogenase (NAD+) subunit PreA
MGFTCGLICPEKHCVKACSLNKVNRPMRVPDIQAAILSRAASASFAFAGCPNHNAAPSAVAAVAVVGGGPAGLSAAAFLRQAGCAVTVFEREREMGGACRLIPDSRLPREALEADLDFIRGLGVSFANGAPVSGPASLLAGRDGVIWAVGRYSANTAGIEGAEYAVPAPEFLLGGGYKNVAVLGGGAIAVDCATHALGLGARVAVFALETLHELPLSLEEREFLFHNPVDLYLRHGVSAIRRDNNGLTLDVHTVTLPAGQPFSPGAVSRLGGIYTMGGFDTVVLAMGAKTEQSERGGRIVWAGECADGPYSAVEAAASGKKAAFELLQRIRAGEAAAEPQAGTQAAAEPREGEAAAEPQAAAAEPRKAEAEPQAAAEQRAAEAEPRAADASAEPAAGIEYRRAVLPGYIRLPVSLACSVLGHKLDNPFILSASPMSDGYERVKKAYEAGWAGAILKTAFHEIPVKTPAEYMYCADEMSYANCDSVSARTLDMLCDDVGRLRAEFPARLTIASTGTAMTGDETEDRRRWQYNTRRLEAAGAMGIEYSLSCPGTDGLDALAVNQDAAATLRVARWILEAGDPSVVKLFKLTASVPSIIPFIEGLKAVAAQFPGAGVAVTIGDTLPNLIFQARGKERWEDGVIMGMGGRHIFPINAFALVKAVNRGIPVSASGGVTSYREAANCLAMGADFVQLCSMPMRYGYDVIRELASGLSHLLRERGIRDIDGLRGVAGPDVVLPFDSLSETLRLPRVKKDLCAGCQNCVRCPGGAVSFDEGGLPVFDGERCVGCSFCVQVCFTGALYMDAR